MLTLPLFYLGGLLASMTTTSDLVQTALTSAAEAGETFTRMGDALLLSNQYHYLVQIAKLIVVLLLPLFAIKFWQSLQNNSLQSLPSLLGATCVLLCLTLQTTLPTLPGPVPWTAGASASLHSMVESVNDAMIHMAIADVKIVGLEGSTFSLWDVFSASRQEEAVILEFQRRTQICRSQPGPQQVRGCFQTLNDDIEAFIAENEGTLPYVADWLDDIAKYVTAGFAGAIAGFPGGAVGVVGGFFGGSTLLFVVIQLLLYIHQAVVWMIELAFMVAGLLLPLALSLSLINLQPLNAWLSGYMGLSVTKLFLSFLSGVVGWLDYEIAAYRQVTVPLVLGIIVPVLAISAGNFSASAVFRGLTASGSSIGMILTYQSTFAAVRLARGLSSAWLKFFKR